MGSKPLRIIQFAREDFAGVGIKIVQAMRRAGHVCHLVCPMVHPQYRYPQDIPQFDARARRLLAAADVVIAHVNISSLKGGWGKTKRRFVYVHGTKFRRNPGPVIRWARENKIKLVCSTVDLSRHSTNLIYNPTPIDSSTLRATWKPPPRGPLVVAHSPSSRAGKGTGEFLKACRQLRGLVKPLLIEKVDNARCVAMKAGAHVFFDSFHIGLQVSGLEAMAIGMPIIAGGDRWVLDETRRRFKTQPYLWVQNVGQLKAQLTSLANKAAYYETWRSRASDFVTKVHSYEAAARNMVKWMGPPI